MRTSKAIYRAAALVGICRGLGVELAFAACILIGVGNPSGMSLLVAGAGLLTVPLVLTSVPSDPKRCTCARRGTALGCPRHWRRDPGRRPPDVSGTASDDLDRLSDAFRSGSLGTLDYLMAVDELEPDASTERWRSPKSSSKPLEDPSKGIARIWDQTALSATTAASLTALMVAKQGVLGACSDCETVTDMTGTLCTRNCRPGPSGP